MVHEISGQAEFDRLTGQKGKLVVVDFTASWCGPCKRVAPQYAQLASQHPDVLFLKVVEDSNKEMISTLAVRAFPTFRFYLEGKQVDETKGANIGEVAAKVVQYKAEVRQAFAGKGMSLGSSSPGAMEPVTAEDARAKRLARFGNIVSVADGAAPDPEVARRNAKLLAAAVPLEDVSVKPPAVPAATASLASPMDVDVDPPVAPTTSVEGGCGSAVVGGSMQRRAADPGLVSAMVDMGFSETRAKKGLTYGAGPELEEAINWLMEHQEDPDIDDPIVDQPPDAVDTKPAGGAVAGREGGEGQVEVCAQSLKCNQCPATVKDVKAAELHSMKTGHSDFSESTEKIVPLTPEEKAAKVAKMKELLAARRAARENEEKVDHVKREKARRTVGKETLKTKEEMEAIARKREIAKAKQEKEAFTRERARLKEEIAKDKAERKARRGKLATRLGVDGYNPSAPQGVYGAAGGSEASAEDAKKDAAEAASASSAETRNQVGEEMMSKAVDLLARQTVAGLGGVAMKTCLAYIKNALTKPEDEKFRSIKLDNNAYKTRIASCVGGTALLKSVGFAKEGDRLFMSMEARDEALLAAAKEKLEAAMLSYVPTKAS